jgi:hypothetical protein
MSRVKFFTCIIAYLFVLIFHFAYASWVINTSQFSLQLGLARTPAQILGMLLLLNGFSLTCFVYPKRSWISVNIILHIILAGDEVIRSASIPGRLPFLLSHLLFYKILMIFRSSLLSTKAVDSDPGHSRDRLPGNY